VVAATGLAVGVAVSARAQAVSATEIGGGATVVLAHRAFWGPELGVARRSGGQGRFAFTAACGDYERALGVRLEATVQFLLRPAERSGIGPYGGLGLAFVGSDGARGASYLTALLGVDELSHGTARCGHGARCQGGLVRGARVRRWRAARPGSALPTDRRLLAAPIKRAPRATEGARMHPVGAAQAFAPTGALRPTTGRQ